MHLSKLVAFDNTDRLTHYRRMRKKQIIYLNANTKSNLDDDIDSSRDIRLCRRPTDLLQNGVDLISILELKHLGGLIVIHALTVEEEAEGGLGDALALGVGLEDLAHLGGLLDLELGLLAVLQWRHGRKGYEKVGRVKMSWDDGA